MVAYFPLDNQEIVVDFIYEKMHDLGYEYGFFLEFL